MARPLMQNGVGQLEEMFAKSKSDLKVLKQLESKLQYRQVPKAVALLTEVQRVICNTAKSTSTGGAMPPATKAVMPVIQQTGLFEQPETISISVGESPVVLQPLSTSMTPPPLKQSTSTAATIPIDEAYKLLSATPGSTWKSIEQTRRLLVQQAHPSRVAALTAIKRAQIEAEAMQVNAAYLRLSTLRCNS